VLKRELALEYGATDIISERGLEGAARTKELTNGVGTDAVLECVGTQESMQQAIQAARPGAMIGYVGVPHGVQLDGQDLFFTQTGMLGGPAPVRQDQSRKGVRSRRDPSAQRRTVRPSTPIISAN
jgi:threonine dehydrogenase-like Zn-dependent dehydrogenase